MKRPRPGWWRAAILGGCLVAVTLAVYARAGGNGFLNYDDKEYVTGNRMVQGGITPEGIAWAFTAFHAGNWHPLTWLSHMLDVQFFGLNPRGHHLLSAGFHALAALTLFWLLNVMTAALWRSVLVASLFALHPLHVESVAWVAERKDVLSGFLFLLTLLGYVRYVRKPGLARYFAVLFLFLLALMSKPVAVTLPAVLLLLDAWPLGRFRQTTPARTRLAACLLAEKTPFILLSLFSALVTFMAQVKGEAVGPASLYPLPARTANAIVSYIVYLGKTIRPIGLAVFYPHPGADIPVWKPATAACLLMALSLLSLRAARQRPYLAIGWSWYLLTMLPMIGLIQVGDQALADRYTYLPLIGLFVMVVWSMPQRLPMAGRVITVTGSAAALIVFAGLTWRQIGFWRDSKTLFTHAATVTERNYVALVQLGNALAAEGKLDDALARYTEALRYQSSVPPIHNNIGNVSMRLGRYDEAKVAYRRALALQPDFAEANYNLGLLLYQEGDLKAAEAHYRDALRVVPEFVDAMNGLGMVLFQEGKFEEAVGWYQQALATRPDLPQVRYNMGLALGRLGRAGEAADQYLEALRLNPKDAWARNNLGGTLADMGRPAEAVDQFAEAVRLRPDIVRFRLNLGIALERLGRADEAKARYREALAIDPGFEEAANRLSRLQGSAGGRRR